MYLAPEMISSWGFYDKRIDIWSLGLILYYMLVGFNPFELIQSEREIISKIMSSDNIILDHEKWWEVSIEAADLVE